MLSPAHPRRRRCASRATQAGPRLTYRANPTEPVSAVLEQQNRTGVALILHRRARSDATLSVGLQLWQLVGEPVAIAATFESDGLQDRPRRAFASSPPAATGTTGGGRPARATAAPLSRRRARTKQPDCVGGGVPRQGSVGRNASPPHASGGHRFDGVLAPRLPDLSGNRDPALRCGRRCGTAPNPHGCSLARGQASYLKDRDTRVRKAATLPSSTFMSSFITSATRRSRGEPAAVSTALRPASSHDTSLTPHDLDDLVNGLCHTNPQGFHFKLPANGRADGNSIGGPALRQPGRRRFAGDRRSLCRLGTIPAKHRAAAPAGKAVAVDLDKVDVGRLRGDAFGEDGLAFGGHLGDEVLGDVGRRPSLARPCGASSVVTAADGRGLRSPGRSRTSRRRSSGPCGRRGPGCRRASRGRPRRGRGRPRAGGRRCRARRGPGPRRGPWRSRSRAWRRRSRRWRRRGGPGPRRRRGSA